MSERGEPRPGPPLSCTCAGTARPLHERRRELPLRRRHGRRRRAPDMQGAARGTRRAPLPPRNIRGPAARAPRGPTARSNAQRFAPILFPDTLYSTAPYSPPAPSIERRRRGLASVSAEKTAIDAGARGTVQSRTPVPGEVARAPAAQFPSCGRRAHAPTAHAEYLRYDTRPYPPAPMAAAIEPRSWLSRADICARRPGAPAPIPPMLPVPDSRRRRDRRAGHGAPLSGTTAARRGAAHLAPPPPPPSLPPPPAAQVFPPRHARPTWRGGWRACARRGGGCDSNCGAGRYFGNLAFEIVIDLRAGRLIAQSRARARQNQPCTA